MNHKQGPQARPSPRTQQMDTCKRFQQRHPPMSLAGGTYRSRAKLPLAHKSEVYSWFCLGADACFGVFAKSSALLVGSPTSMILMYVCVRRGAGLMGCLALLMSSAVMEARLNSLASLSNCRARSSDVEVCRPEGRSSAGRCALAAAGLP